MSVCRVVLQSPRARRARLDADILATMSVTTMLRGCYEKTASVELKKLYTEVLGAGTLHVDSGVGDSNGTPDVGPEQLAGSTLGVGVRLVGLVRRVPVALGEPTVHAASTGATMHRSTAADRVSK